MKQLYTRGQHSNFEFPALLFLNRFAHVIDIQNHLICRVSKSKKWLEVRQTLLPVRGWGLGTTLVAPGIYLVHTICVFVYVR